MLPETLPRHLALGRWQHDVIEIRDYRSSDLEECRRLYAQLVERHGDVYHDPTIGGDDPRERLRRLPHASATRDDMVRGRRRLTGGPTGLLWEGSEATIEPVAVDRHCGARNRSDADPDRHRRVSPATLDRREHQTDHPERVGDPGTPPPWFPDPRSCAAVHEPRPRGFLLASSAECPRPRFRLLTASKQLARDPRTGCATQIATRATAR